MKDSNNDCSNPVGHILRIIDRLRSETGCPWDRKQTPETVQTYLVEESHEAAAAIRSGKTADAAEELGDVLFMALFLIYLYEERGDFNLKDVCLRNSEKMIRRHPHVFGEVSVNSAEEVKDNWEKIKADEKREAGKVSERVPETLPALIRAYRVLSRRSYRKDEDWNDLAKQGRELARQSGELVGGLEEPGFECPEVLGGLFVRLVNIARLKGYRAEDILHDFLRKIE